jgi:hypothetical protein
MPPLRTAFAAAVALALSVPAAAQDAPSGPSKREGEPAAPAAKAPPAAEKKERKADPKATAALERYRKLLHTPGSAGVKHLTARGELKLDMLPEPVVVRPRWKSGKDGFALDVEIPESVKQAYGPEAVAMIQRQFGGLVNQMVAPLFTEAADDADAYDLAAKEEGGAVAVTMTPFDDARAKQERQKLEFGADGLLSRVVLTPKVDPEDPNAALMAGVDIDVTLTHEKRGERYVTSGFTALLPMGEMKSSATFWDGPGGLPLPKTISLTLPISPEPFRVDLWDYVLDGKAVEATAKPKEPEIRLVEEKSVGEKPAPGPEKPAPDGGKPAPGKDSEPAPPASK